MRSVHCAAAAADARGPRLRARCETGARLAMSPAARKRENVTDGQGQIGGENKVKKVVDGEASKVRLRVACERGLAALGRGRGRRERWFPP